MVELNEEHDGGIRYYPEKAKVVVDTYGRDYSESEFSQN